MMGACVSLGRLTFSAQYRYSLAVARGLGQPNVVCPGAEGRLYSVAPFSRTCERCRLLYSGVCGHLAIVSNSFICHARMRQPAFPVFCLPADHAWPHTNFVRLRRLSDFDLRPSSGPAGPGLNSVRPGAHSHGRRSRMTDAQTGYHV